MNPITAALLGGSEECPRTPSALTPKQFASHFRANRQSVYRWIQEGIIPGPLVEFAGKRKIFISVAAVDLVKRYFAARGDSGDTGQRFESRSGRGLLIAVVNGFVIVRLADGQIEIIAEADFRNAWRPLGS